MSKFSFPSLNKLAEYVSSENIPESISALMKAFELFNKETHKLEKAYNKLKNNFHLTNIELQKTNQELRSKIIELDVSTNYLNSILGNISQGIIFIDKSGMITTYNIAAEKIFNIQNKDILFHSYWENFADDSFGFSMRQVLEDENAPEATIVPFGIKELEINTTFVNKGSVFNHGAIILIKDITVMRKLQILANRNNRMKEIGEMAASVAHEIRNPLGGIEGFASLLYRDLSNSTEQQQMAHSIIQGVRALNRLVSNVLNYARPLQLKLKRTNMQDVIADVVTLVKADPVLLKTILIQERISTTELIATIDLELIKAALLNLIRNSIQAMSEGKITISLSRDDNNAIIEVSDTGKGIPEDNLENIFSPFFTTKATGTGIGLAEVHKIVKAHGGIIDVKTKLGKGTTFVLSIPLNKY